MQYNTVKMDSWNEQEMMNPVERQVNIV